MSRSRAPHDRSFSGKQWAREVLPLGALLPNRQMSDLGLTFLTQEFARDG